MHLHYPAASWFPCQASGCYMHHSLYLPNRSLAHWTSERFFLSIYVMLLRKAFKLACNGSHLSKGRAGNSILFESCFLLSKQERGTSKKEKLHILCIFWTLHQFNVACLYSCLSHFLFYKVNLILLQKYLHVTTECMNIFES